MFATGTRDMTTSMIVNFHVRHDEHDLDSTLFEAFVDYRVINTNSTGKFTRIPATCFHLDNVDEETRFICWADLINLKVSFFDY